MTTAPVSDNRLGNTASPYLEQHADNPVHWQPWDEKALSAATELDRPIFLSVGYAACHWCHVMEEESFEDSTIATILNEHYVPIKVDREERPDIDRIYQTICQLVTHSGGWPLSAWLTPDGRPFYVGTYFPAEPRRGMPGFKDLLEGLAETWETDRNGIEERADQWYNAIKNEVELPEDGTRTLDDLTVVNAADAAHRSADSEHGGFGKSGPKFPQTTRIQLVFRAYHRTNTNAYLDVGTNALDAMKQGGLFDHVGGGFHRYAVDQSWTVPHFEKMLYDNAELVRAYLAGYQLTEKQDYARTIHRTLEFVQRELGHPDGGFYSTLDAQSEGEEGTFYVWTPDQIHDVLADKETADLICDRYGITETGNFEGKTVLTIAETIDTLAEEYNRSPSEIRALIEEATETLRDARENRERPARDEKILAGWNGLMISAFADTSLVLDADYAQPAADALSFIKDTHWDGTRLARRYRNGTVGITGYLDDYAFLARAALDVYQATGSHDALGFALDLADTLHDQFWDENEHVFYYTPSEGESLIARPQELTDQSTPASTGIAIDTLLTLSHFTLDSTFETVADQALNSYANHITSNPLQHAALVLAADRYQSGSEELTIVADSLPTEWREKIGKTYLPNRLLSLRPPELSAWLDDLGLESPPPIWADRDTSTPPVIYACQSFSCSPPYETITDALDWFEESHSPL